MANYAELYNPSVTPQSEPIPGEDQVANNAGGFVYSIGLWGQLDRFLILGSDAPTYYQNARELTRANAEVVVKCFAEDAERTVNRIVEISEGGRALKNDPAIFALALGAIDKDVKVRQLALGAVSRVCRTGTHLFQFVDTARKLGRGFGRAMKWAVAHWYDARPVDKLAYQVVKYRQREGYTHERLLDLSHPAGDGTAERDALYHWIVGKEADTARPALVVAHERAMATTKAKELLPIVRETKLPWEALPTWALTDVDVQKALLPDMGLIALVRQLGRLTQHEVIKPLSREEELVVARLESQEDITCSRIHPFQILLALATYQEGKGFRGSGAWTPLQPVLKALDGAFYRAFTNAEPVGKRFLLALDVSGSMTAPLMGSPLSCRAGAAAMALVTLATEPRTHVVGFYSGKSGGKDYSFYYNRGKQGLNGINSLKITAGQRLDDVVRYTDGLDFGGTDCSLPMLYAQANKLEVDVFVVLTDNETWAGNIHPSQALRDYRRKSGIDAKLVVVGMTATEFSIADPKDGGMLDVVGFDAAAPAVISDFARG